MFRIMTGNKIQAIQSQSIFEDSAISSLDGCSTEDGYMTPRTPAKMHRSGSKYLSLIGIQRDSGKFHVPPLHVDKV